MLTPGLGVEMIEQGTYTVRLDAPFTVTRAGAAAEEEVAAGTEVTLHPGDVARFPDYSAPGDIRNAGADPVSVLGLAILSQESTGTPVPGIPSGVDASALSSVPPSDWSRLPPGPVAVTLRRLSLPVGAELAPYEVTGLEAIYVDEGELSLAYIPVGETAPSKPMVYRAGRTAAFPSVLPGTRRVVRNDGDTTATILVLTIRPG